MTTKRAEYPLSAFFMSSPCQFQATESRGDSGEKKHHVKMVARSGQPINHPFWGPIVHDNEGAEFGERIPIDYAHDDKEVIGFAESGNIGMDESGDLVVGAELVPFSEGDRASEVLYKSGKGVPYEASINFAGDVVLQELGEKESAEVNGYTFEGPGVIVRKWPLRGVAVCPYGADSNTRTETEFSGSELLEVTVIKGAEMATEDEDKELEAAEEVTEEVTEEAAEEVTGESTESTESTEVESPEDTAELAEEEDTEEEEEEEDAEEMSSSSEFSALAKRYVDTFGEALAGRYLAGGLSFDQAMQMFCNELKDENARLKSKIAHFEQSDAEPVNASAPAETNGKARFNFINK